jgi:hypothetical protein
MVQTRSRHGRKALSFPNPSRSYDDVGHGVRFWGYDETIEVSFFVEEAALLKLAPETTQDEAGFLHRFDAERERIHEVAGNIYARQGRASRVFAYTLPGGAF